MSKKAVVNQTVEKNHHNAIHYLYHKACLYFSLYSNFNVFDNFCNIFLWPEFCKPPPRRNG